MPTIPRSITLSNSAVDILNVIRNNSSTNYRNYVPKATGDLNNLHTIGAVIMDYPALQNEFLNALVNRIARVYITSKTYKNPLSLFKKGILDYGETIEEIFVDLINIQDFDVPTAEKELFKREIPDVKSAFHVMNYRKFYKVTVSYQQLKTSFLSFDGVNDLITKIVEMVYTSADYDEFLVMKYLLAKRIIDGRLTPFEVSTEISDIKTTVSTIKGVSNKLTFMSRDYNVAGVPNHTPKDDQYILMNSNFDAVMDVEVLASAFNMTKAEFVGKRVLIDGFGDLDIERLNEIFKGSSEYEEISQDVLDALNTIPCCILDREFFMIFDNLIEMREAENGQGLYWNYFYHIWKTFSVSPFANAVVFTTVKPEVTSVAVTPTDVTLSVGDILSLTTTVETNGFAPKTVNYHSDNEFVEVSNTGVVKVLDGATSTEITVTSTYDPEKSATVSITIE